MRSQLQPAVSVNTGVRVAVIMDGNGRWASERGLPREAGHKAGREAVRRIVGRAPSLGIGRLTLFAFSSDNWKRPPTEVAALMDLFREYFVEDLPRFVDLGIRSRIIGRRDRLPAPLLAAAERAEEISRGGTRMTLEIALDYSARLAILEAARRLGEEEPASPERFTHLLAEVQRAGESTDREVDLLIRTGGEKRLSDCILWEAAYAEMVFSDRMWPDFGEADLESAVLEFHSRERRFGGLPAPRR